MPKNSAAEGQMYSNLSALEFQKQDKVELNGDKYNDSAYTEEDPKVNEMYISRKAVENVLKQQKHHMSLCRSYRQSSVGNRNSSSSLESFNNSNNTKVNMLKNTTTENPVIKRDSGSWSVRTSSSSSNSIENSFLTVVGSKRTLHSDPGFVVHEMFSVWVIIGAGVGGGIGVAIVPYLFLSCLGFTNGGVKAHSRAANIHSSIGDVEAGSCFASCQSAGAGGIGSSKLIFLFLVGFAITVTLMVVYNTEDSGTKSDPFMVPKHF
ncbi:unnamed protein product [Larinioides sclopetarius]|uniref:Uncharacterized protein n=1 Tax=Larinioides sclopetarius TaxID=280406 RepID=A0AAV2AQU2_9ARAC